jgi:cytosine/adenosine deaminase-related metal-dependent hydrolase
MVDPSEPPWTLTARWVFPVEGPPLEGGTVTIQGHRILAVESRGCRTADKDLGNAALLPGFVNAHTHLDLTGLRGRVPPGEDFPAWLRAVIGHRRRLTPEQVQADVQTGLNEALAFGTTLLGDISAQGLSWPVLSTASLRSVVFYELLGLPRARAHQVWATACQWLNNHPATGSCRPGLSPHAPYSVRDSLFRAAANLARQRHIPLAIHLAETRSELELLEQHRGPFADFLSGVGVWDPAGLVTGPGDVLRLNAGVGHVLFAHGNYFDVDACFPPGVTVVYCPRTHAAFGHAPHPFQAFLAAGVRVALGTDSLASNPNLDVLGEARFLCRQFPEIAGDVMLRMATLSGAEALDWQTETGSLAVGKSADLVVLPLPDEDCADPHRLLWQSALPVAGVLLRGAWVYLADDRRGFTT